MADTEDLRKLAHDAPLNPVRQDHKGRRSLGNHSMAWASASREYMKALAETKGEENV